MGRRVRRFVLRAGLLFFVVGLAYTVYLDFQLRGHFEGRRWSLPARVFARPLEVFDAKPLGPAQLERELGLLHYRRVAQPREPGQYRRDGDTLVMHTRGFRFADKREPARAVEIQFANNSVRAIRNRADNASLGLMRLEPVPIANFYPQHNEDRILVRLQDTPQLLIDALLSVEDRRFYTHHGVNPASIARALVANLKAGKAVQGGSTITQQLIKNFYLSNDRSLWRKANEAIMAVLLDFHYSKDEILEAYLNEIYLGQDGERSVHGVGLASQFYFQRSLQELKPEQIALLVALVKGASYYDPRRHPQRARERRDLVLDQMQSQGFLSAQQTREAKGKALGVSENKPTGISPFPAFLQLVREQLRRDYRDEDLHSEGLFIFTTFDPLVQLQAEQAVTRRLSALERTRGLPAQSLQAAVVVSTVEQGEVLAMLGGRDARYAGFNRALDARRPIGSLVKPAVYLTALEQPEHYSLVTQLDDSALTLKQRGGRQWTPMNYDHEYHSPVSLLDGLVNSYNISTARLGLALGLDKVVANLHALGLQRPIDAYPSVLLGALDLSPMEVTQMYQTFAAGGYRTPLRAIREVMNRQGEVLQRYPLALEQKADPAAVYLLTTALHEVTTRGTARALQSLLPADLQVAGKTGTTDDLRDSWFAGYSADHTAVVWIGRDDNQPIGLTGASGALLVWSDILRGLGTRGLQPGHPDNVEWVLIDPVSALRAESFCEGAQWVPFIRGSAPRERAPCTRGVGGALKRGANWFKGLFE